MEAGEVMYDFYASVFLRIDRQEPWKEEDLLEMFLHEAVDLSNPGQSGGSIWAQSEADFAPKWNKLGLFQIRF